MFVLVCVREPHLYLCGQVLTDRVQQRLGGLVFTHEDQLQVHVVLDEQALGHQADPQHPTQRPASSGLPEEEQHLSPWSTTPFITPRRLPSANDSLYQSPTRYISPRLVISVHGSL